VLQGSRGRIPQQFLELRVELARIDSNGLRRRGPVALTNQTSEYASRCAAVDGDERRLDGVVQTAKVVRVLLGRTVSDELQKVRWDAGTRRDKEAGENKDQRTRCLVGVGPLRLVRHDDRAFQGHPDIIRVDLHRLQQETLAGLESDESTDLER